MKKKISPSPFGFPPLKLRGGSKGVILELEAKLAELQKLFAKNEAMMHTITQRRVDADMGDDYHENEPAKLVMERHDVWWVQRNDLIREITNLKKKILSLKK